MKSNYLAVLLLLLSFSLEAQIDTMLLIEDIYISSNRIQETEKETPRNIAVFTKEQIKRSTATTLPELLQYVAGVDIKRRGIRSVQSDISMRGGTFNQVLVMLNNVKMIDPQTGHHMMSIPINVEDIERIEVTKGPAARIYGQNAFSGVVNIITKMRKEDKIDLNATASLSSFTTLDGTASLRIPNEHVDQLISVSASRSKGYRYNTDYKIYTGYYASDIHIKNQKIQVQGGYTQRKFGANGFYASEKFKDQYEEVTTAFASIASPIIGSNYIVTPRLSWRNNKDHYVFIRSKPEVYENNHTGNVYNAEVHGSFQNSLGTTGVGIDYSYQTLISNNLGNRKRSILGASVEHKYTAFDKLDITAGAFINKISNHKIRIYPGVDLAYHINDNSQIFASWNYANRLPTYTNLYYTSRAEQGNENLLPEDITAYELGYKIWKPPVQLVASIYYNDNKNLIDWAKASKEDKKWQALNISKLRHVGLDMALKVELDYIIGYHRPLEATINYGYINAKNSLEGSYIGRYTLSNLNHQFACLVHTEIVNNLSLDASYRFYDREVLKDYQILDLALAYKIKNVGLKFTINNVLNMQYRETNLVPMPGRWYGVTLSLR